MKFNVRLRDMNVCHVLGAQLAIDVTLRSAMGRNGEAQSVPDVDGAVLLQARTDKEMRLPEFLNWAMSCGRDRRTLATRQSLSSGSSVAL